MKSYNHSSSSGRSIIVLLLLKCELIGLLVPVPFTFLHQQLRGYSGRKRTLKNDVHSHSSIFHSTNFRQLTLVCTAIIYVPEEGGAALGFKRHVTLTCSQLT